MKATIELIDNIIHYISKTIKQRLWFYFDEFDIDETLQYPIIDVVIPLIEKDLQTAGVCIDALIKYSLNPINKIYLVSPRTSKIINFALSKNLEFINEDDISPLNSKQIIDYTKSIFLTGWLKQQLIKLSVNLIPGISEHILLLDSDTILIKKQYFICNKHSVLKFSDEYHFRYKLANNFILNDSHFSPLSYIAHHQLVHKFYINRLKIDIENMHKKKWYFVFLDAFIRYQRVSEYELYAHYIIKNHKSKYKIQYWFNCNKKRKHFFNKVVNYDNKTHSISYHNYDYQ